MTSSKLNSDFHAQGGLILSVHGLLEKRGQSKSSFLPSPEKSPKLTKRIKLGGEIRWTAKLATIRISNHRLPRIPASYGKLVIDPRTMAKKPVHTSPDVRHRAHFSRSK